MLAADTNVLVRFVTNDDRRQGAAAREVFEAGAVFVSSTVLLEAEWVLRSSYGLPKAEVLGALKAICALPGIVLDQPERITNALLLAETGLDFADALHLAAAEACEAFVTFDRRPAKLAARSGSTPVRPL